MNEDSIKKERLDKNVRFFPLWLAATFSIVVELIEYMLDEIIMGQLFDDNAFAAINMIEPIAEIRLFIGYMICVGGAALILRAHGERNNERMKDLFSMSIILSLLFGIVFSAILIIFDKQIINFFSGGSELYDLAYSCFTYDKYMPIIDIMNVFLYVYVMYFGGTIYAILSSVVSVCSNTLFSLYFGNTIGIAGIRLGTLISLIFSTIVLLTFFINRNNRIKLKWYLNIKDFIQMCIISIPESSIFIALSFLETSGNLFAISFYGVSEVVILSIAINVYEIIFMLAEGMTEYETVAINEYIGQGNLDKLNNSLSKVKKIAFIENSILIIICFVFSGVVVSTFGIDDIATTSQAITIVKVISLSSIFISLIRIFGIYYQYTNKTVLACFVFIFGIGVFPTMLGMLFGLSNVILYALGMDIASITFVAILYLYIRVFKHKKFLYLYEI